MGSGLPFVGTAMRLSRCLCTGLTLVSRLLLVAQYASGPGHLRASPFPSGHFREHWFFGAPCEPTQNWQTRRLPPFSSAGAGLSGRITNPALIALSLKLSLRPENWLKPTTIANRNSLTPYYSFDPVYILL